MRFLFFSVLFCAPLWAQSPTPTAPTPTASSPVAPEGMVFVPAGEFIMGTDQRDGSDFNQRDNTPLSNNDARPQHTATTGAFFIDKTEVTNAQYQKFLAATGYAPPPHWKEGKIPPNTENWPVTRVNWYEAREFARWAGKRLPTEIEWEKAARGTDGRRFPWGNDWRPGQVVEGGSDVQAVGKFPGNASPYGALDMAGNAFEWTLSWFDAYPNAPTKQPDFGKTLKAIRGGTWIGTQQGGQTWYRSVMRPLSRSMFVGFRCVKDA